MTVQLADEAGMVWDERHWKWAPRVLKVSGRRILVNDVPVYFNGVTEHCYFAETTNAHFDTAKYLRDLGKLKTAGFNFC